MTRKMAGAADDKLFLNPVEIKGNGKIGPTGVDHIAAATLKFENGIIGEIIAAVECSVGSSVFIYGTEGSITIPSPWLPHRSAATQESHYLSIPSSRQQKLSLNRISVGNPLKLRLMLIGISLPTRRIQSPTTSRIGSTRDVLGRYAWEYATAGGMAR